MFSFLNAKAAKPATPDVNDDRYSPARRAYGDITSEARVQRKNAMLFAAGCLVLAGIASYGQSVANTRPTMVPYVIRIDKQGNAVNLGVPPRLDQDPTTTTIAVQYQLRQFIQAVRSVTYDPSFQTKLVTDYVKPFLLANSEATTLVNDFYKANDPYKTARTGTTIDAQVKSVIPQTNTTFALDWTETTHSSTGVVIGTTEWKGFATVELGVVPTDPQSANLNPMGMYLVNLTWQSVAINPSSSAQQ